MESMAVVVAAVESVAIVNAAIVSAAKVSAVIASAAMVSAARWRAGGEDLDEAAASAATSVGGTSLGAPVSRLALSGRPPRPLLMRIACSISLSYNVRVHSRPAGGRAGSCQRVSVAGRDEPHADAHASEPSAGCMLGHHCELLVSFGRS